MTWYPAMSGYRHGMPSRHDRKLCSPDMHRYLHGGQGGLIVHNRRPFPFITWFGEAVRVIGGCTDDHDDECIPVHNVGSHGSAVFRNKQVQSPY